MATYSWLGTTATWSTATNWMTGGLPAVSAPGTTDDCVFDGSGGGSSSAAVTLTASTTVSSVDFNGYTGTFTHNSGQTLTISGGGATNRLRFVAGMIYTKGSQTTSALSFTSPAGTTLITFGGKIFGNTTFGTGGVTGGTYQFQDTAPVPGTVQQTFTGAGGTLDLNGQTANIGVLSLNSGSATRVLTAGSATINIIATTGTVLDLSGTGATASVASAVLNLLASTGSLTINIVNTTFGTVNFTTSGFPALITHTGATITTLSIPAGLPLRTTAAQTLTISNAFTWAGTPSSPLWFGSGSVGSTATISVPANSSIAWASIRDVTFSGNAITASNSFNNGNNSGITINPPMPLAGRLLGGFLE